jgi:hypothetical protein
VRDRTREPDVEPESVRRERGEPPLPALLLLQRAAGNRAVTALVSRFIGPPPPVGFDFLRIVGLPSDHLRIMLDALEKGPDETGRVSVHFGAESFTFEGAQIASTIKVVRDRLRSLRMGEFALRRAPMQEEMQAAETDEGRRLLAARLREFDDPWLEELKALATGAANPWAHEDPAARDAVLAALQLRAVASAEADHQLDAATVHERVRRAAGMEAHHDWCGFFAVDQYIQQNMDTELRSGMFHVDNVVDYFNYVYNRFPKRIQKWIHADGDWHVLRGYHEQRGALRTWTDAETLAAGGELDVRPGDLALVDHDGKSAPDHIVMVRAYDPVTSTVFLIGGNDSGMRVDSKREGPFEPADPDNPTKQERLESSLGQGLKRGARGGVGVGLIDLDSGKGARLYGVGRPSIVDFEDHRYAPRDAKAPNTPPRAL